MKKMIYLTEGRYNKLNDYEKEHGLISYRTLVDYYDMSLILCNKLPEIDDSINYNVETGSLYDEETDEFAEIYQWYITDLTGWMIEDIKEKYSDELIITYSDLLETYVLCVDHFGTSWSYVLTDIKFTTDYDEYQKWEETIKKEDQD